MCTRPHLELLPDGTFKHRHPVTHVEVWNIPGRSLRPLSSQPTPAGKTTPTRGEVESSCAFCPSRRLETPPEKQRWRVASDGSWSSESFLPPARAASEPADFRRIANLYEIVPLAYWKANHGFSPTPDRVAWRETYCSDPFGRHHILALARTKSRRAGNTDAELDARGENNLLRDADPVFFGSHDLVIAGSHFPADGSSRPTPCSSGDLSPAFHRCYLAAAAATAEDILRHNPKARNVAVFQNWLPRAGASFEHLHKQLVAFDEIGPYPEALEKAAASEPGFFNKAFLNPAISRGWTIAGNPHAVAVAAFGVPYPAVWIFSTARARSPWALSPLELSGFSDILHACHAASGPEMPSNEEWFFSPPDRPATIPFHVVLRWRPNTHAGFEGDTGVFISPLRPDEMRNRLVDQLIALRKIDGRLGDVEVAGEQKLDPLPSPG